MAGDALLRLEGVRKTFGKVVAVDECDLSVEANSFFSLLGPSGCGKTTTLRMISGFEKPDDGRVVFNGRDVVNVPPNMRDTNMVFQHLSLFPHMSVRDNVAYGLKKSGVPAAEQEERVSNYLELVDLAGFGDRRPSELSGGQQQRVALARALVNEPSLLLFDEPLASLDRKLRQQMQVELSKIHRKVDTTFFYVTHDQEVAMTLSDRLAIMRDGRIEQVGTPREVYNEPANLFVADFIGDMNLFEGHASNDADGTSIALGGENGPTYRTDAQLGEGNLTVAIRPENIEMEVEDNGLFEATVVERYFQGDHTEYVVRPTPTDLPELTVTEYRTGVVLDEGTVTSVGFRPNSVHTFDSSGAATEIPPLDFAPEPGA